MKISLVIATYQRHDALCRLLTSIKNQKEKPFEVIIIDASENESTKNYIRRIDDLNIIYIEVAKQERGSAQQRNHGLDLVDLSSDIVAFLDDDLILEADYFEKLIETYQKFPDAIGVGGIDLKNNMYEKKREGILYK
jgi:GT2 family glycosyltransferase